MTAVEQRSWSLGPPPTPPYQGGEKNAQRAGQLCGPEQEYAKKANKKGKERRMSGKLIVLSVVLVMGLEGCMYYQEYRQMKGEADVTEERAELLKAQRLCFQKYESDPQADERCGVYRQMLNNLDSQGSGDK